MISFIHVVDYLSHENMFGIFQGIKNTETEKRVRAFGLW